MNAVCSSTGLVMRFSQVHDKKGNANDLKVGAHDLKIKIPCKITSVVHFLCFGLLSKPSKKLLRAFIKVSGSFIDLDSYFKALFFKTPVRQSFIQPITHSLFFLKLCLVFLVFYSFCWLTSSFKTPTINKDLNE